MHYPPNMPAGPCTLSPASREQVERVSKLVDDWLADVITPCLVDQFYSSHGTFAGDTFLALVPNEPNKFSPSDLLAITLLEVNVAPLGVRRLLPGGRLAPTVSMLLERVPLGVPIWEATDAALGWATCLWHILDQHVPNVGPTTAGKLLARKRPELIPIVDETVTRALKCTKTTYWSTFREVLGTRKRRGQLEALRPGYPLLRTLDTVIWMHNSESSRGPKEARNICAERVKST